MEPDSDFRTVEQNIVDYLVAQNVIQPGWALHYQPVFYYPADTPHFQIYFLREEQDRGPWATGSRLYKEIYQLRYWEPTGQDGSNLLIDSSQWNHLENLLSSFRNAFLVTANTTEPPAGPWRIWWLNGRLIEPQRNDQSQFVHGMEAQVEVLRARDFT